MRRAHGLVLLASMSSPAWAQGLASGAAPGIPWLRLFLSFAFCAALAFGGALLLRHYQRRGIANPLKDLLARPGGAAGRRITIIETRRASVHADLCLVECDGETYFLALTPAGASVLDRNGPTEAGE